MHTGIMGSGTLADLMVARPCKRARVSSYDKAGGNYDCWTFKPGVTQTIAHMKGAGIIRHIWVTIGSSEEDYLRKIILRMYWDGERTPSVEAPIGDFFGLGHARAKNFISAPLQMSPEHGKGFNAWFPMPFHRDAILTVQNECAKPMNLYFYIDYESYAFLPDELLHFHAQWRRENPTKGWTKDKVNRLIKKEKGKDIWAGRWKEANLDGKENYVILDAHGKGHYVGCHLDIDQFDKQVNTWYGEGDDMIFIDGDTKPTLHGTGTEDYVNMAYCPTQDYHAPYHGLILYEGPKWRGKNSCYRYHIEDPIQFERSIKVTIEHGHANKLWNDYSSTAYWYQTEPHGAFPKLLSVKDRLPRW